jgi:hypothetical protein
MKNPQKREVMVQAYRLLEQFETPSADAEYWARLGDACGEFVGRWTGKYTQYASKLSGAIFDALEDEYRAQENKPA